MRTWLTLIVVSAAAVSVLAVGGIEGTMEYALDAPWRIEPSLNSRGQPEFGSIPIQISIHDSNLRLDPPNRWPPRPYDARMGNFCSLVVEERAPAVTSRRHFDLRDLDEIETSGPWRSADPAPRHRVCRPDDETDRCEQMRLVAGTAEWHAVAWYLPVSRTAGSDIPLRLQATVTKNPSISCDTAGSADLITLENHATVHLGEAALPRFGSGWLYGDLHYHSQGTDNEGESGYNYRGVVRAMGALGLDFAFAMEHASNSPQTMDADVDLDICGVDKTEVKTGLRDMSSGRFRFLNAQLHDAGGVNRTAAYSGPSGRLPQNYLSHGVIPQIFLGGELDAIPETATAARGVRYGNGLRYDTDRLQHGAIPLPDCGEYKLPIIREQAANGWLIRDVQGLNDMDYGREHLVYLPQTASDQSAFIASDTGPYGGARRRLAEVHKLKPPLLPEIHRKGYAFLAHPLNDGDGGPGPDGPPWSEFMIEKAWRSERILGLQFWNEPGRRHTEVGKGDAKEIGYEFGGSLVAKQAGIATSQRLGFDRGRFALRPYYDMDTRSFHTWSAAMEKRLHHGAFTWDTWLLHGLEKRRTFSLGWLPDYEPRRFFMAGGSDAHGDLNYRREGYFTGTSKISDVAIGKPRNLVFAGAPTLACEGDRLAGTVDAPEAHSHCQVVDGIAAGHFSVSDGPALRILIDRNRNGRIDDEDTPMGGVVELYGERDLPVIVEWRSTREFRGVERISLYVGARPDDNDTSDTFRVYAPPLHGPRNGADLPGADARETYTSESGVQHVRMKDNYWRDPTGRLLLKPARISGVTPLMGAVVVNLPLSMFEANRDVPGKRFYVRAFAETSQKDSAACAIAEQVRPALFGGLPGSITSQVEELVAPARQGACIRHYAFTNPVWAITKPVPASGCQPSARALDRDRDGLPDGCDPCPTTPGFVCRIPAPSPGRVGSAVITRPRRSGSGLDVRSPHDVSAHRNLAFH